MKIGHLLHLEGVVVNKESHEAASQRQGHKSEAEPLFLAARVVVAVVRKLKDVVEVEKALHVVDLEEIGLVEVEQQVVVEQVALIHEVWNVVQEVLPSVPSRYQQELAAHWVGHHPWGPRQAPLA